MRPQRATRRAIRLVLTAGVLIVCAAARPDATSLVAWSAASSSGGAGGRAVTMPAGRTPTAAASGVDVTVRWPAALLPDGTPVAGYRVERLDANGQSQVVAANCSGTITTTTCTERGVPAGTWSYVDIPVQDSWSGAASAASAPATVG